MFNTHNNNCVKPSLTQKSKAFTIIELLVVIAIIGLLSSVVLVSMKGSTGKAKIAKSLEFSQTILNTIGVDAVGVWSFDEGVYNTCPGGTADVCDKSGYGNHGTITGATFVSGEENTPHWFVNEGEGRSALNFDGNDYIDIPNIGISSGSFTIEGWVKPSRSEPDGYGTFMGYNSTHRILIHTSGKLLTQFGGSFFSTNVLSTDKWSHIVYVYNVNDNKEFFYINGVYDNEHVPSSTPVWNSAFRIGHYDLTNYKLRGSIDEVRIYECALSSSEIQQHYAAGAEKHQLAISNQ